MYYLNPDLVTFGAPAAAVMAALFVLWNYRRKLVAERGFGERKLLSATSKPLSPGVYIARAVLAALAAASLMVALARPIIPNGTKMIAEGTVDVVAVIDVSRSMAAMDYDGKVPSSAVARPLIEDGTSARAQTDDEPGTRLEMVRYVLFDYMLDALKGNQVGIVSYAGQAFPQAFLTKDSSALRWVVDRGLTVSSAPGEGSAMGKALELSLLMLEADSPPEHEKLIVIFSDGGNDDPVSKLSEFAGEARKRNIKVVVVGMGNVMPSKIPVSKLAADDDYAQSLRQHGIKWYEVDGQVEKTAMDSSLLQDLANRSAGRYIHMQQLGDLDLHQYIGKNAIVSTAGTEELFPWALGASLVFLLAALGITGQLKIWGRWRKQS